MSKEATPDELVQEYLNLEKEKHKLLDRLEEIDEKIKTLGSQLSE